MRLSSISLASRKHILIIICGLGSDPRSCPLSRNNAADLSGSYLPLFGIAFITDRYSAVADEANRSELLSWPLVKRCKQSFIIFNLTRPPHFPRYPCNSAMTRLRVLALYKQLRQLGRDYPDPS